MNTPSSQKVSKRGATHDGLTVRVGREAIRRFDLVSEYLTGHRAWVYLYPPPEVGALCYNDDSPLVAEGDISSNLTVPSLNFRRKFRLLRSGIGLAVIYKELGGTMARTQWLLLGAVGLAVAIVV